MSGPYGNGILHGNGIPHGNGIGKTLRITFSLRNTYRVNNILYALKQIPLIGRILPETLYQERGLKILANVISVIW